MVAMVDLSNLRFQLEISKCLERNIVFLKLLFIAERLLGRRLCGLLRRGTTLRRALRATLRRTLLRFVATALIVRLRGTATGISPATEELEVVDDNAVLGAFSAALLVFPGVVLQSTLNQD